jgi:hypothetical protein
VKMESNDKKKKQVVRKLANAPCSSTQHFHFGMPARYLDPSTYLQTIFSIFVSVKIPPIY